MNRSLGKPAIPLFLLAGYWLMFLLTACGSTAALDSGNNAQATPTLSRGPKTSTTPIQPSPSTKLTLTFTCQGDFTPSATHERVCVRTQPGAALTIKVTYCKNSIDQSSALKGTFIANKTGDYEWSWTPKAACKGNPPGGSGFWEGTAEVTATSGGQTLTSKIAFIV